MEENLFIYFWSGKRRTDSCDEIFYILIISILYIYIYMCVCVCVCVCVCLCVHTYLHAYPCVYEF